MPKNDCGRLNNECGRRVSRRFLIAKQTSLNEMQETLDQSGSQGYAVPYFRTRSSTSCGARYSTPVSYGPEVRYRTSSALCECGGQWFLIGACRLGLKPGYRDRVLYTLGFVRIFGSTASDRCTSFDIKLGWVLSYQDRTRQEAESERHMDVTSESW